MIEWKEQGVSPDMETYNSLMYASCREGFWPITLVMAIHMDGSRALMDNLFR